MKKGNRNLKDKIPLKCFVCGGIGNYSSKCPYVKVNSSDDEVKLKPNDSKQR